jgi:hypothetical protein
MTLHHCMHMGRPEEWYGRKAVCGVKVWASFTSLPLSSYEWCSQLHKSQ